MKGQFSVTEGGDGGFNLVEKAIFALSSAIELRDSYTASHQKRVGKLAQKLARKLGLSCQQCRGIKLAGLIHDMGKLKIPAEILSKPGQLTEAEFELIKEHPRAGAEIIRDIDFPWPLATMILQHHEKLDGSGYPRGLQADDILLESRILTVADVVEAMTSRRPYRPALGIEAALEEIKINTGIKYDRRVVSACLDLYQEGELSV